MCFGAEKDELTLVELIGTYHFLPISSIDFYGTVQITLNNVIYADEIEITFWSSMHMWLVN